MDKLWTKEQLRAFIKENNLKTAGDAQQALKELFKDTIQEMLECFRPRFLTKGSFVA